MKLIRIHAFGFKGRDAFSYDLQPMTLFYGANFRGKSRVMDAVRLALLGYLPELGNTNPATFGLASGTKMEVCAEFDNGLRVIRTWTLSGNSVKKTEEVPDEFKALGDLSVMLNAESYFGLGDRARVDYVFAHCPAVGKPIGVYERLLALSSDEVNLQTLARIQPTSETTEGEPLPLPVYIERMIELTAVEWKEQKAGALRAEKMIQQLTAMRLGDDPTASIAVVEAKRTALAAELAALNERKGGAMGNYERMKADVARRADITRELAEGDQTAKDKAALTESFKTVLRKLESDTLVFSDEIEAQQAVVVGIQNELHTATRLQQEARAVWQAAEKALDALDAQTTCPYCGASGDGWKTLQAAALTSAVDQGITKVADYEKAIHLIEERLKVAKDAKGRLSERAAAQRKLQDEKGLLVTKIAALDAQLARLQPLIAERERLAPEDANLTTAVQMIQSELNVKNDALREMEREIKVLSGRQFELKRLADAEKERDAAKLAADYAAAVGKELRVIQGEMVTQAFEPLLERANSFFSNILLSRLAYHEGEIGTWRDGQWVGHRTFSGTEKALTYAAIQMALAMSSPLRLMLIDELGRLDAKSMDGLLVAVENAMAVGLLDGFVGIAPFLPATVSPSLQVIQIK